LRGKIRDVEMTGDCKLKNEKCEFAIDFPTANLPRHPCAKNDKCSMLNVERASSGRSEARLAAPSSALRFQKGTPQ
jgi:hypothetical protein